ncbi:hypothetical protein BC830DRAFT_719891 [Chytriomyces sp. MP71]|nr:hypothetical protein BC830DRAFT_719891 [Chytriomyces sp. MP71]
MSHRKLRQKVVHDTWTETLSPSLAADVPFFLCPQLTVPIWHHPPQHPHHHEAQVLVRLDRRQGRAGRPRCERTARHGECRLRITSRCFVSIVFVSCRQVNRDKQQHHHLGQESHRQDCPEIRLGCREKGAANGGQPCHFLSSDPRWRRPRFNNAIRLLLNR